MKQDHKGPKENTKKMTREEILKAVGDVIRLYSKTGRRKPYKKLRVAKKGKDDDSRETIDYLRVCAKYTLFDLEAARREIMALKKKVLDAGGEL